MEKIKKDSKTTINIRIDSSLKNEAEFIIDSLGLSTSAAIILFFKALVREKGLPFEVKMAKGEKKKEVFKTLQKPISNKERKKAKAKREKEELTFLEAIDRL